MPEKSADGFLKDPLLGCPPVVTQEKTTLGPLIPLLDVQPQRPEDGVFDEDIILLCVGGGGGDKKRVITGADILGRLLRGIVESFGSPRPLPNDWESDPHPYVRSERIEESLVAQRESGPFIRARVIPNGDDSLSRNRLTRMDPAKLPYGVVAVATSSGTAHVSSCLGSIGAPTDRRRSRA